MIVDRSGGVVVVVVVVAKVVEGALVAVFARARLVEAKVHLDSSLVIAASSAAAAARCRVGKGGRAHNERRVGVHIAWIEWGERAPRGLHVVAHLDELDADVERVAGRRDQYEHLVGAAHRAAHATRAEYAERRHSCLVAASAHRRHVGEWRCWRWCGRLIAAAAAASSSQHQRWQVRRRRR